MGGHYRYLPILLLGVAECHHIARHALASIGVVTALNFATAEGASVIVDGNISPVCSCIDANLFCLHGVASGQAAGGHPRLFQNSVPKFLHMAQADANARVICVCGDRSCQKKGCYNYSAGLDRIVFT